MVRTHKRVPNSNNNLKKKHLTSSFKGNCVQIKASYASKKQEQQRKVILYHIPVY